MVADPGCSWRSVVLHLEGAGGVCKGGAGLAGWDSDRRQLEAGADDFCDWDKFLRIGGHNGEHNDKVLYHHQPPGPHRLF